MRPTKQLRAMFAAAITGNLDPADAVVTGGMVGNRVRITYHKKTTGETVEREVRPYERKNGYIYATDTMHGKGKIHSFIEGRILHAEPLLGSKYTPQWPIKLRTPRR